jgi:hypothetical protein
MFSITEKNITYLEVQKLIAIKISFVNKKRFFLTLIKKNR